MANNLQKKPFLDYHAQIKYLKQKQLVINNEAYATTVLEKSVTMGSSMDTRLFSKTLLQITFILVHPLMISIICTYLMLN